MSTTLTDRQAQELHKSIVAYLTANNLHSSAAALRTELNLGEETFDAATTKGYETLLERKWTSVLRLQKKNLDLESRNAALQLELDNARPSLSNRNVDPVTWLPKAPARHCLESHKSPINCIAFHPVFSSVASGSDDCTIKIWDWELGELEKTVKGHTRAVTAVDFGGPRGAVLLASCSSDLTIKLWDPADDYKNIRTLPGHDHSVSSIRFIPSGAAGAPYSGNLLVSASRDTTLKIWDVTTGYCVRTLSGHSAWIRDVTPSLDGRFLLSTGDDKTARIWDISSSNPSSRLAVDAHEHVVECCAIAPPASYQYLAPLAGIKAPPASSTAEFMATGSRDKSIKIWDARGTCLRTLIGHDNWVRALVFHPGGKFLFSVSDDKTLRCWDLQQEGKCVKVLRDAHERFVTCLRWAPGIVRESAKVNGSGTGGTDKIETNGSTPTKKAAEATTSVTQIRCVIATGGVDQKLRIFAN